MEMPVKNYLLPLFVLSLILSACSSGSSSPSIVGTWKLTAYGPADSPMPAVSDAEATITFDVNGTLSGSGGCNSLGGDYEVNNNQITFGPIMSTLMGCDEPRMTQEGVVHQVMDETATFQIEGNTLIILKSDTVLIFALVAAE